MEILLIIIILILLGLFWPVVGFLAFVFGAILILWLLVTITKGLILFFGKHKNVITEAYCIKCRVKREMNNPKEITIGVRGGKTRMAMTSNCSKCGTKMFRIKKVGSV